MCSYTLSRDKPVIFQATAQAQPVYSAGLHTGTSLAHELNLLKPDPPLAANPMMGGRVLS